MTSWIIYIYKLRKAVQNKSCLITIENIIVAFTSTFVNQINRLCILYVIKLLTCMVSEQGFPIYRLLTYFCTACNLNFKIIATRHSWCGVNRTTWYKTIADDNSYVLFNNLPVESCLSVCQLKLWIWCWVSRKQTDSVVD